MASRLLQLDFFLQLLQRALRRRLVPLTAMSCYCSDGIAYVATFFTSIASPSVRSTPTFIASGCNVLPATLPALRLSRLTASFVALCVDTPYAGTGAAMSRRLLELRHVCRSIFALAVPSVRAAPTLSASSSAVLPALTVLLRLSQR
jgi:hypothetical protein